jgi:hypothetical protein
METLTEGPQGFWSEPISAVTLPCFSTTAPGVYLDQMFQDSSRFETAEEAVVWLRRQIEERAAKPIFSGLARARTA